MLHKLCFSETVSPVRSAAKGAWIPLTWALQWATLLIFRKWNDVGFWNQHLLQIFLANHIKSVRRLNISKQPQSVGKRPHTSQNSPRSISKIRVTPSRLFWSQSVRSKSIWNHVFSSLILGGIQWKSKVLCGSRNGELFSSLLFLTMFANSLCSIISWWSVPSEWYPPPQTFVLD